jgi:hypothetical protein
MPNPVWRNSIDNAANDVTAGKCLNAAENDVEATSTNKSAGIIMRDTAAGYTIAYAGVGSRVESEAVDATEFGNLSVGDEVAPSTGGKLAAASTGDYVIGVIRAKDANGVYGANTLVIDVMSYLI